MSRQNKKKSLQKKEKQEIPMTEQATLEPVETLEMELTRVKSELQAEKTAELDLLESELDRVRNELEATKKKIRETKEDKKFISGRELDEEEIVLVRKHTNISVEKQALKQKIAHQQAMDNVMVTGKFINRRAPGQEVKLPYLKYAEDQEGWKTFRDGQVYTIKRGFADQINEYYHQPVFTQKFGPMDQDNPESQIDSVNTDNKKYTFVPINF